MITDRGGHHVEPLGSSHETAGVNHLLTTLMLVSVSSLADIEQLPLG